jgi:hypothetical protein
MVSCDNDSEFEFQWHGPSSILDWSCKILLIVIYSCITCVEIVFCGRWRDFWPFYRSSRRASEAEDGLGQVADGLKVKEAPTKEEVMTATTTHD